MILIEFKQYYQFDDVFDKKIISGFTRNTVAGIMPQDFFSALADIAPKKAAYMKQIHTAIVHKVTDSGVYQGDGLFTDNKDLGLVVRTADCLPLILRNADKGVIGVVHMGWKSAQAGIIENIPFDLTGFIAIAGLGMRKCCYQVGEGFLAHKHFLDHLTKTDKGLFFDPISFAKTRLIKKGLNENNFFDCGICSVCDKNKFPSWRRDKTDTRTLNFIFNGQ